MEVVVKNVPYHINASQLTDLLSQYCKISECKLNEHSKNPQWNGGRAWVTLDSEESARELTAQKLSYYGRPLNIRENKKRRSATVAKDSIAIPISNLELGNWKTGNTATNRRRNRKGKKRADDNRSTWSFLNQWEYPEYYVKPRLIISQSEGAFYLEGFSLLSELDTEERRVKLKFKSFAENYRGIILDAKEENGKLSVFFHVKHPPELYRKMDVNGTMTQMSHLHWLDISERKWSRTEDWTGTLNVFGNCKVLRLVFTEGIDDVKEHLVRLEGITCNPLPLFPVRYIQSQLVPVAQLKYLFEKLPFIISFKLESLISHGIITAREILDSDLTTRLRRLIDQGDERTAWCALNQLLNDSSQSKKKNPISLFEAAVKNFKGEYCEWYPSPDLTKAQKNKRCAYVNQAIVTPTKIYFDGPNFETSNRILRRYFEYTDRFIRVTFTEENFERIFSQEESKEIFNSRIRKILKKGFHVAGRDYQFLAFSSSGLRERSCWFVASDGEFTAEAIRDWMGDFSGIRIPALYASRMGQAFTTTVGTIELTENEVQRICDVERNGHVFSDGCGKISRSLAKRVTKIYWGAKSVKDSEVPSVFQIRFGGCKGVVAVDPTLEHDVLCIRPSQSKFESTKAKNLEICKAVRNSLPAHLNRQIILLLSSLGVEDTAFLELQKEQEALIDAMMWNPTKAREVVQRSTHDLSHIGRVTLGMIGSGLLETKEPFLQGILEAKRCRMMKDLRCRARIAVPNSFLLMGVMDETGILGPKEVFVQTSTIINNYQNLFSSEEDKNQGEPKRWTGKVVVTRNPCLHPGDISVLTARDVPELHHMKNCIVFSQNGPVPIVHTMSGGDLDGDEYFVSFEEQLIPKQSFKPMSYERPPCHKLDRPVEIEDVCDFFTDFMQNDRLGHICNLHMAHADFHMQGPKHPSCVRLAELASKAVDFNKTGTPVTGELEPIDEYPDFLENRKKKVYESNKILGQLYRRIQVCDPEENRTLNYLKYELELDPDFEVAGYEEYLEDACALRNEYNHEIYGLMTKYDIKTEPELVTGDFLHFNNIGGKKDHDVRETLLSEMAIKVQKYRRYFRHGIEEEQEEREEMDDMPFNTHVPIQITDEAKAKAYAWYFVTYDDSMYGEDDDYSHLSFAWLVADILLNIRQNKLLQLQLRDWDSV